MEDVWRQRFGSDDLVVAEYDGPFDGVLQFADISGPGVFLQIIETSSIKSQIG